MTGRWHRMNAGNAVVSPARPDTAHSAGPQDDRLAAGFALIDQPSFGNDIFRLFLLQAEWRETILEGEVSRSLR